MWISGCSSRSQRLPWMMSFISSVNQMWLSGRRCAAKHAEKSRQCWIKAWNTDHYSERVMRMPRVSRRWSALLKKQKPRIRDILIGSSLDLLTVLFGLIKKEWRPLKCIIGMSYLPAPGLWLKGSSTMRWGLSTALQWQSTRFKKRLFCFMDCLFNSRVFSSKWPSSHEIHIFGHRSEPFLVFLWQFKALP